MSVHAYYLDVPEYVLASRGRIASKNHRHGSIVLINSWGMPLCVLLYTKRISILNEASLTYPELRLL